MKIFTYSQSNGTQLKIVAEDLSKSALILESKLDEIERKYHVEFSEGQFYHVETEEM